MHFKVRTDMVSSVCLSFRDCESLPVLVLVLGGAGDHVTPSTAHPGPHPQASSPEHRVRGWLGDGDGLCGVS